MPLLPFLTQRVRSIGLPTLSFVYLLCCCCLRPPSQHALALCSSVTIGLPLSSGALAPAPHPTPFSLHCHYLLLLIPLCSRQCLACPLSLRQPRLRSAHCGHGCQCKRTSCLHVPTFVKACVSCVVLGAMIEIPRENVLYSHVLVMVNQKVVRWQQKGSQKSPRGSARSSVH